MIVILVSPEGGGQATFNHLGLYHCMEDVRSWAKLKKHLRNQLGEYMHWQLPESLQIKSESENKSLDCTLEEGSAGVWGIRPLWGRLGTESCA